MKRERLCEAIKKIAWGYILIHVNFNLGTLNILPNWAGYLLFLSAIPVIGEEDESTNLLKPLGTLICVAEICFWLNALLGGAFSVYIVEIIISVISLYFHFQLLTNLANVAHKYSCSQESSILILRTVKTILLTIFVIFSSTSLFKMDIIVWSLAIIYLIVAAWICKVLFSFKNELSDRMKMIEASLQDEVTLE